MREAYWGLSPLDKKTKPLLIKSSGLGDVFTWTGVGEGYGSDLWFDQQDTLSSAHLDILCQPIHLYAKRRRGTNPLDVL